MSTLDARHDWFGWDAKANSARGPRSVANLVSLTFLAMAAVLSGCAVGPWERAPVEERSIRPPPARHYVTRPAPIEDRTMRPPPLESAPPGAVQASPAVLAPTITGTPLTAPPPAEQPAPATPAQATLSTGRLPASSNTAVVALLDKADDQAASGQLDSASASLERALRIEPDNPGLWHELATVRLRQGKLEEAAYLAQKSNSLAGNRPELQARNWRLIAVVQQKQGHGQAASEALERARSLERGAVTP